MSINKDNELFFFTNYIGDSILSQLGANIVNDFGVMPCGHACVCVVNNLAYITLVRLRWLIRHYLQVATKDLPIWEFPSGCKCNYTMW